MESKCLITPEYVNTIIRNRPEDTHKGQCGRVLIVAGKIGMAGAAVLSASAALKSGAGLVTLAVPMELFNIVQISVPQATCVDIKEAVHKGYLENFDSIAVGPGMGVDEEKYNLIKKILREYDGPIVLDADGINCICKFDKDLYNLSNRIGPTILTPHPGEGERLLEALGEASIKTIGREMAAQIISKATSTTVLMKGAGTVVTSKGSDAYINTTGNPGMATGGSGDVLTGVIAALVGAGIDSIEAAKTGAYIHGLAGDIAAQIHGQWGMTSLEIAMCLPAAFKKILGK